MLLALVVAFIVCGLCAKTFAFVINAVGSLMLYGFTDSAEVFADLDATANILGFVGGLCVASRCYRWINPAPTDAPTAASSSAQ
jgi:hypothetical protein